MQHSLLLSIHLCFLPRLQGYESEIATHIGEMGVEVVRGGMVDNEELGSGKIAAVFQTGFKLGDKIIRHAMVQVTN